ncbi:MAG: hypothetical protein HQL98_06225 [Magnetococcales bacterium]|nr:hypothetical protein [Magnetococcales bacterium]
MESWNRPKRNSFNPKRKMRPAPQSEQDQIFLNALAARVGYGGNPEHKRNPGDFGLTPPSHPRPDKTLCDQVGIFTRAAALCLLRTGIKRGFGRKC